MSVKNCTGKLVESGDIMVLADGYRYHLKNVADCGKETKV